MSRNYQTTASTLNKPSRYIATSFAPIGEMLICDEYDATYYFAHAISWNNVGRSYDADINMNICDASGVAERARAVLSEALACGDWEDLRPEGWRRIGARDDKVAFAKDMERRMSIAGKRKAAEAEGVMELFG